MIQIELVKYDPDNFDTYPSVCVDSSEVRSRFGFTGGEVLVFTDKGGYMGQLVSTMEAIGEGYLRAETHE
jgi:hypothetical protein